MALPEADVRKYASAFHKTTHHRLAKSVLNKVHIDTLASDPDATIQRGFSYTLDPPKIPLTDQKSSGRCWIFSFTNMIRRKLIKAHNLSPDFMLSQKYLLFYDHLEKCNALLEIMYFMSKHRGVKTASLEMSNLRESYVNDGGTWHAFVSLVEKYGLVPFDQYPDNGQAMETNTMGDFLSQFVSSHGVSIEKAASHADFLKIKHAALQSCYNMLEAFLGAPPVSVTLDFTDAKGNFHRSLHKPCTPQEYYMKYVHPVVDISQYIVLINDPRNPYHKMYSVELLHNVLPVTKVPLDKLPSNFFFNVPIDVLRDAVFKSIKGNMPVPFAADVKHYMQNTDSRMDTFVHYEDLLGVSLLKPRKVLFENLISSPNHAMLFIGTNGNKGEWQVENSWGQENDKYPYLTMSDDWFEHYVGEIIVHRRFVPQQVKKQHDKEKKNGKITFFPIWDVFGTLAKKRLAAGSKKPKPKN